MKIKTIKSIISTWKNPVFISQVFFSVGLFTFSVIINYYAVRYATENAGRSTQDFLFILLPYVDTKIFHTTIAQLVEYITLILLVINPIYFNVTIRAVSILVVTRAIFVNLTYLGIPEGSIPVHSYYTYGGDLFFSGHVAIPFLIALIFWEKIKLRYLYLCIASLFGIEVLMGHYHYSIDVFAAPFIAYGIFALSKNFFLKKDFKTLQEAQSI
jgi:membrane-associated phospholipid phosphatase